MSLLFPGSVTRRNHRLLAVGMAICMALALATPQAATAAPPTKVVIALINAAQKEFDAGNFERAGDLFRQIWQQDPSQVPALYNAARAYHLAGKWDAAEELYRSLLVPDRLDAAQAAKVRKYQKEIPIGRANAKAVEASNAEKSGNYALAAQLWAEALRFLPDKLPWRLRAARAHHLAGHTDEAMQGYDRILTEAPKDAPERTDAHRWREELKSGPASVRGSSTPDLGRNGVQPETVTSAHAESTGAPVAGYITLTAGAVGLVAGGVLLALARSADADLQARFATLDAQGNVSGISKNEGYAEADRIESQYRLGWVAVGAGAVGAAVGTWLVLRHGEDRVSVMPNGRGVLITAGF